MKYLTDAEWEMLAKIDNEFLNNCNLRELMETLTAEEVVAMIKWVNNNTDNYLPLDEDYSNLVAKSFVIQEYISGNIINSLGDITKVKDMISVWKLISKLS